MKMKICGTGGINCVEYCKVVSAKYGSIYVMLVTVLEYFACPCHVSAAFHSLASSQIPTMRVSIAYCSRKNSLVIY